MNCPKCEQDITSKIAQYCHKCGYWFPPKDKPIPHRYMDQEGGLYDTELGMYVEYKSR